MSDMLPTPFTSPTPATQPISAQINAATRKQHTELNRLIIDRLHLALPPQASTPVPLGRGLATFAHIFFAFEACFDELEPMHRVGKIGADRSARDRDIAAAVATLRPCGLARTGRLELDLAYIEGITSTHLQSARLEVDLRQHVQATVADKPHVLIAYAWVMYMAIFSGGRWIREQLANAGPEFWRHTLDHVPIEKRQEALLSMPGYTFLSFAGTEDGEDIKAEFKARLGVVETLLTQQERQEVVNAAQELFGLCIGVVQALDRLAVQRTRRQRVFIAVLLLAVLVGFVWLYWYDNYGYLGGP